MLFTPPFPSEGNAGTRDSTLNTEGVMDSDHTSHTTDTGLREREEGRGRCLLSVSVRWEADEALEIHSADGCTKNGNELSHTELHTEKMVKMVIYLTTVFKMLQSYYKVLFKVKNKTLNFSIKPLYFYTETE